MVWCALAGKKSGEIFLKEKKDFKWKNTSNMKKIPTFSARSYMHIYT